MSRLNSIPKYGHEAIRLAARQVRECVMSHPRRRAGHEERTAPESDKRNGEQILERICSSVGIGWSSKRKNSRPFKTHLSRLGGRHLVAGVLWFPGHLVLWLAWSASGCPDSFLANWCSRKVRMSIRAARPGSLRLSRPSARLPSELKG